MRTILILAAISGLFAPRTVVVQKGETLAAIAKRELDDGGAGPELAALNGLAPGAEPKRKMVLRLPGPERTRALDALAGVEASINAAPEAHREPARALLKGAWAALRSARYTEAEAKAKAAEKRASGTITRFSITVDGNSKEARFSVEAGALEVKGAGRTTEAKAAEKRASGTITRFSITVDGNSKEARFSVEAGALEVKGAGKTTEAKAGDSVRVAKGAHTVRSGPPAPALRQPADGGVVDKAGAQLSWAATKGARGYLVVVARDLALLDRVATFPLEATAVTLPPALPKGVYYWRVSAVGADGTEGPASGPRVFEVTREPGKGAEWDWGPIWDPWGRGLPGSK